MTTQTLSRPEMKRSIDYIIAKLETIHEDVAELKKDVEELKETEAGRKAIAKVLWGIAASVGALLAAGVNYLTKLIGG